MVFIYEDLNDLVSVLLNIDKSKLESIVSSDRKIFITLKRKELYCPKCNKRLILNGFFKRDIFYLHR